MEFEAFAATRIRTSGVQSDGLTGNFACPWCCILSTPTNKPGKFDLWIELKTKDQELGPETKSHHIVGLGDLLPAISQKLQRLPARCSCAGECRLNALPA